MCLQTHKYRIVYVQIIVPVLGPSPRQVANYTPSQLLKVAVISIYILFFFSWEALFLEHSFGETSWGMISTFFFPPPTLSHPSRLSQRTRLSSLAYKANSRWLSNFTYGNVNASVLFSQVVSPSASPAVSMSLFSMSMSSLSPYK